MQSVNKRNPAGRKARKKKKERNLKGGYGERRDAVHDNEQLGTHQ
jgi:hypothetical protein